jgi:hypothetical protein
MATERRALVAMDTLGEHIKAQVKQGIFERLAENQIDLWMKGRTRMIDNSAAEVARARTRGRPVRCPEPGHRLAGLHVRPARD